MPRIVQLLTVVFTLSIAIAGTNAYALNWSTLSDMPNPIESFSGVELNGKLYAVSKVAGTSGPSVFYEYDISTDTWRQGPTPPLNDRCGIVAAAYNNLIYLFGGVEHASSLPYVSIYNPSIEDWSEAWSSGTNMPTPIQGGSSTANIIGDKIYVSGHPGGSTSKKLMIYDPSTDSWVYGPDIPTPRDGKMAATVNGKLFFIGGQNLYTSPCTYYDTVEVYDPASNTWTTRKPMPTPRAHAFVGVWNNKIYVMGGLNLTGALDIVEVYDPDADEWTSTDAIIPVPLMVPCYAQVGDTLYVYGGSTPSGRTTTTYAVTVENQCPIANAGENQSVHIGSNVTVSGSASFDPEGNYPLTYSWTVIAPNGCDPIVIPEPQGPSISFPVDCLGDYSVELVVTDTLECSSEPAVVTVSSGNVCPTADSGEDQSVIQIGTTVTLDGSQSWDDDGDDDDLSYSWIFISRPPGVLARSSSRIFHAYFV